MCVCVCVYVHNYTLHVHANIHASVTLHNCPSPSPSCCAVDVLATTACLTHFTTIVLICPIPYHDFKRIEAGVFWLLSLVKRLYLRCHWHLRNMNSVVLFAIVLDKMWKFC